MNLGSPKTVNELLPWSQLVGQALGLLPHMVAKRLTTTANTPTVIASFPIEADAVMVFKWTALGRQTSGSSGTVGHGLVIEGLVAFHLVSGTATIIGAATTQLSVKDDTNWAVAVAGSGNQAQWTVTGATDKTIAWRINVTKRRVTN